MSGAIGSFCEHRVKENYATHWRCTGCGAEGTPSVVSNPYPLDAPPSHAMLASNFGATLFGGDPGLRMVGTTGLRVDLEIGFDIEGMREQQAYDDAHLAEQHAVLVADLLNLCAATLPEAVVHDGTTITVGDYSHLVQITAAAGPVDRGHSNHPWVIAIQDLSDRSMLTAFSTGFERREMTAKEVLQTVQVLLIGLRLGVALRHGG